jgi:hypothetical protein
MPSGVDRAVGALWRGLAMVGSRLTFSRPPHQSLIVATCTECGRPAGVMMSMCPDCIAASERKAAGELTPSSLATRPRVSTRQNPWETGPALTVLGLAFFVGRALPAG